MTCDVISRQGRHGIKRKLADHDSIESKTGCAGKLRTNPKTLRVQKRDHVTGQFGDVFSVSVENDAENVVLTDEQRQYDLYVVAERGGVAWSRNTRASTAKSELRANQAAIKGVTLAMNTVKREQERQQSRRYLNCKNRGGRRNRQVWRSPNAQAALSA